MAGWDTSRPHDYSDPDLDPEEAERTEQARRRRRYAVGVGARSGDPVRLVDVSPDARPDRLRSRLRDGRADREADLPRLFDLDTEVEPGLKVREVLSRFEPDRLGLPDVPLEDAARYIADRLPYRPWLRMAEGQDALVQRVYAALDRGHGHLLQRHEGFGGDGAQFERVTYLRDPAQRTDLAYLRSVDGFKRRDKQHGCGGYATRFHDPMAFATAVARVQEHPLVRAALDMPYAEGKRPETIEAVTLAEALGSDGHQACSGYHLVGADQERARANRQAWVNAVRSAVPRHSAEKVSTLADRARERAIAAGLEEPTAAPIESFEGGRIRVAFKPNRTKTGYELLTLFASPYGRPDLTEEEL